MKQQTNNLGGSYLAFGIAPCTQQPLVHVTATDTANSTGDPGLNTRSPPVPAEIDHFLTALPSEDMVTLLFVPATFGNQLVQPFRHYSDSPLAILCFSSFEANDPVLQVHLPNLQIEQFGYAPTEPVTGAYEDAVTAIRKAMVFVSQEWNRAQYEADLNKYLEALHRLRKER